MRRTTHLAIVTLLAGLSALTARAQTPLGTAWTYQGELTSEGTPASGPHDLRFSLFDAVSGGNQVGTTLCSDNLPVNAGRFTVSLDFGPVIVGQKLFLEIEVREDTGLDCADGTGHTVLAPRQELTATPYAAYALAAENSSFLNGRAASFYSNAQNLQGILPSRNLEGTYSESVIFDHPANVFVGNGTGLYYLNATNISSGVLAAARMPIDWSAGGDLVGNYPNPMIVPGAVTLNKLAPGVQDVLSNLINVPSHLIPFDPVAWGQSSQGQLNVPALPPGTSYTALAGGAFHSLALRSDGNIVAWGGNPFGQLNVPALPVGLTYTAVSAGYGHNLALRSDGNIAAWGFNPTGQTNVPALPLGLAYAAVSAGEAHSLALRGDGSVVAWGSNGAGQLGVPELPVGVTYTAVAAGFYHNLALRSDGSLVAWGSNSMGQTDVPALPPGLTYTAAAGGLSHSLALRSDGSVVAWGSNASGQTDVPALPVGVTYTAVAAGEAHSLALRSDGIVVAFGANASGQTDVPSLPAGASYAGVAAGQFHSLALRGVPQSPYLGTEVGLAVGIGAPTPAPGGLGIAGDSTFAGGLSAAWFTGDGAGLTDLNAAHLNGALSDDRLSSNVPRLNTSNAFAGALTAASFAGDGAGLTNLTAANLNGTVSDGLLSGNIPRLSASNSFAGGLTAPSFSGSGAGLTNLDASNLATGTVGGGVLPARAWNNLVLPVSSVNSSSFTNVNGTSQSFAMRQGVAVISWSTSGYTNPAGGAYAFRIRALTNGVETLGPASVFYFNQSLVHTTISGNAVVSIPATATTTFSLQVRGSGTVGYQTDNGDSFTATIINIGP